jgi:hypothetical protein
VISRVAANMNFIVFGLTRPDSEKSLNEENLNTFHKISTLMTSIWYILVVTG